MGFNSSTDHNYIIMDDKELVKSYNEVIEEENISNSNIIECRKRLQEEIKNNRLIESKISNLKGLLVDIVIKKHVLEHIKLGDILKFATINHLTRLNLSKSYRCEVIKINKRSINIKAIDFETYHVHPLQLVHFSKSELKGIFRVPYDKIFFTYFFIKHDMVDDLIDTYLKYVNREIIIDEVCWK